MTIKHFFILLAASLSMNFIQAQSFVENMPGCRLHCRITDQQLHQVEVESVEITADTAIDFCFPEWVRYRGVRYAVVSAQGGLFKNNDKMKSLTTGTNMQYLGSHICFGCKNLQWISIGTGLKGIGCAAFSLCYQLDSLDYNAISCKLDQSSFDIWLGCYNLRKLHLGNQVEYIDENFLCHCSGLDCELHLPASIRHIGSNAFEDCSSIKGTLVLPPNLETVGTYTFAGFNSVDTLIIQSRMLKVPNSEHRVFYHSINPVDVIFDSQVVALPAFIFARFWGLRSIQIPNHIDIIPAQMCVYDTNLLYIKLPDSLRMIGPSSFYNSGLKSIEIPNKTFMIHNYAFAYCYNLTEAIIGEGTRFIGDYCFVEDTVLRSLKVLSPEPPRVFEHTFSEMDLECITLQVPLVAIEEYRRHPIWGRFPHIIVLPQ